ncbi:hypothetical protein FGO68_gene272 [Halteria grandinella]|uniref:Uncharacterized protein n=1 Tax=Halteria grandinella TaxID=5974 RepID=A0A8J8NSC9_HALGN|nr:hypothetical protein FGO68_gene272 [Halteria grandinella]
MLKLLCFRMTLISRRMKIHPQLTLRVKSKAPQRRTKIARGVLNYDDDQESVQLGRIKVPLSNQKAISNQAKVQHHESTILAGFSI